MWVWLTLPFYDFCGFRSVAVNSVYKLQFLTFIFAVLLPVFSRLLIVLIVFINTTFFDFSTWRPSATYDFWIFEISAAGLACYSVLFVYVRKNFCHMQVLRFFVCAIHGQDMVFFWFFKIAATTILDFWNFKFLTVGTLKRVELHHRSKFRRKRSNRGWDMAISRFLIWRPPPSWISKILNF